MRMSKMRGKRKGKRDEIYIKRAQGMGVLKTQWEKLLASEANLQKAMKNFTLRKFHRSDVSLASDQALHSRQVLGQVAIHRLQDLLLASVPSIAPPAASRLCCHNMVHEMFLYAVYFNRV